MARGNVFLGLLAGAAAGAVAGLLLAPDKGTETRRNLTRRGREAVDGIKGKVNDMVETVTDKYMSGNEGNSRGTSSTDRSRSGSSQMMPGSPSPNSFT